MFKLRAFRPTDLDRCVAMFVRVYGQPPWEDEWPSEERAKDYLADIVGTPGFEGFVAYEGRRILGVCLGHKVRWWAGDQFYMDELFVDTEVQRSGIGTALVEYAKQRLAREGVHLVVLLTQRETLAESFYAKQGFVSNINVLFMYQQFGSR